MCTSNEIKTNTQWISQQQNCLCLFGVSIVAASTVSLCLAVWRALAIDMSLYLFISQDLFLIITSLYVASNLTLHKKDQLWHGVNVWQAFWKAAVHNIYSFTIVFTFTHKDSEQVLNLLFSFLLRLRGELLCNNSKHHSGITIEACMTLFLFMSH